MLLLVTNIPTPYRTAFYNFLKVELEKLSIGFHVLYCAKTEPRRFWKFSPDENKYSYTFLEGFHPKLKNYYPHFNFGITKQIKKLKPNWILLGGSWNAPVVFHICAIKNKLNIPLIFWSEGHLEAQRSKSRILDFLRRKVFLKMDAFVVPNGKSKSYVLQYNKKVPIGFLPNTIDENYFCSEEILSKTDLRERHEIFEGKKVVLCVATISERKGSFELLNAYNLLSNIEKDKLVLIYLGTGDLIGRLKDYVKNNHLCNVLLLGQKSSDEVREYLKLCDFFILPTKLDPNPLTPIEASFMKTPLILSRFAGNHDELITDDTGFSILEITPAEIKIRLSDVIYLDNTDIEKMGNAAYENVKNKFSMKFATQNLISFLKEL